MWTSASADTVTQSQIDTAPNLPEIPIAQYIDPAADAEFLDTFKHVELSSVTRPHILTAQGNPGEIRVRNVNYFVQQVNDELGLTGTPYERRVRVNRLAAYIAPVSADPPPSPVATVPVTIDDLNPYTLPIPTALFGEALTLRFEYLVGAELKGSSSFSEPPVTIQTTTNLTQYELYPDLFGGVLAGVPTLRLSAQPFVALQGTPGNFQSEDFTLSFNVDSYQPEPTDSISYTLAVTGPCAAAAPAGAGAAAWGPGLVSSETPVTATDAGTCTLTADVTLADGNTLTQTLSVQIVPQNQRLVLQAPAQNASLPPGVTDVGLRWAANNAPSGVTFELEVDGSPVTLTSPTTTTATITGLTVGPHTWSVTMNDSGGNVPETRSRDFTITQGTTVDFEWRFLPGVTGPQVLMGQGATQATHTLGPNQGTADFNLMIPDCDPNFVYHWSVSWQPPSALDAPSIGDNDCPPVPDGHSLQISDLQNNTAISGGNAAPLVVTLTVNTPAGAYAGSITKTLTLALSTAVCGDGRIESGEQCDQGGGNVATGDGCDASCRIETNWTCSAEPSDCVVDYAAVCSGADRTYIAGGAQQGCWVKATGADSCETACAAVQVNPNSNLHCVVDDPNTPSVDEGDWNDSTTCEVCNALTGATNCSDDPVNYAPYALGTFGCRYRNVQRPTDYCSLPGTSSNQRICKCQ